MRLTSPAESQHGFAVITMSGVRAKNSLSSSSLGLRLLTRTNSKPSTKTDTPLLPSEEGKGVIMINRFGYFSPVAVGPAGTQEIVDFHLLAVSPERQKKEAGSYDLLFFI